MNRGVIAYMREGTRCAKNTFKNFINTFKYYFLGLVIFFGSLCPITLPFVTIISIRVARLAERDEDIQIFKSFERVDNSKTFWTILGFYFFNGIFFLSGLVLLAILGGIFFGVGILIGGVNTVGYIIGGVLALPIGIVLLAYLIVYPFMMMPAIYLYDCNPKLGLSGMFYNSVNAMRKTGKWTIFMMSFLYSLRIIFWLALVAAPAVFMIIKYDNDIIRIACSVLTLGFGTVFFFKFAKLLLAYQVALVLLFNDICSSEKYISLDQTEENTPKNVYGVSKRTLRAAKKEQLLLGLFTNGEKLVDPEGVDQTKLPNEVEDDEEEFIEEEILADDELESVTEVKEASTLVNEDGSIDRRESARYYKEPVQMTEIHVESSLEEKVEETTEPKENRSSFIDLFAESLTEVVATPQPAVEETVEPEPVVEKPKRGRKKATVVEEESIPTVEESVSEEIENDSSVTEEEIESILDNILNVDEISEVDLEETPQQEVLEEIVEKPKRGRKKVVKEEE